MEKSNLNKEIAYLRNYFKSQAWEDAIFDDKQPVISDNGMVTSEDGSVTIDTHINLALDFEGYFNEMARKYMQYRKAQGMSFND